MVHFGWRAAFYMFGTLGVGWSIVWYRWFRDSPAEKPGISAAELGETSQLIPKADHGLPWKIALRSANLWAVLGVAGCYIYTYNFFQSWFHTYLVKDRGFSENDLLLSSVPFLVGGCANLLGGLASNVMVKKLGLEWGRRSIGLFGLAISMFSIVGVLLTHDRFWGMILLSLVYGGITFQQPSVFAVCLDIGGQYAGAVVGAMNTSSQVGAFVSSLAYGYLVARFGSYNVPFLPMLALLLIAAGLWFKVDPNQPLMLPDQRLRCNYDPSTLNRRRLFDPQRLHRIDGRRAARRNHSGNARPQSPASQSPPPSRWYRPGDLIELRLHKPHAKQRHRNADRQPQRCLDHRSAHHHRNHAAAFRAQRHADADLRRPPRHRIGRHAVQPDRRQQQRQRAKQRRQPRNHPLFGESGRQSAHRRSETSPPSGSD